MTIALIFTAAGFIAAVAVVIAECSGDNPQHRHHAQPRKRY